jgi:hypothetical protein
MNEEVSGPEVSSPSVCGCGWLLWSSSSVTVVSAQPCRLGGLELGRSKPSAPADLFRFFGCWALSRCTSSRELHLGFMRRKAWPASSKRKTRPSAGRISLCSNCQIRRGVERSDTSSKSCTLMSKEARFSSSRYPQTAETLCLW